MTTETFRNNIRGFIGEVVRGQSLTQEQASQAMEEIMEGRATPAQIAAFATALRMKGETVDEVTGMALTMLGKAKRVQAGGFLVDTCGTGGDRKGTINVSTAASFVVAGAGATVAKHGGRSASGGPGSADCLQAAGVKIDLGPDGVKRCIEEVGIGFMFAPVFHPAMAHALKPRQEIGIHTVFNMLGPLTNPARAQAQLLGVANPAMGDLMAQVLGRLGAKHAWVVYGEEDGLDEVSVGSPTRVWELKGGRVRTFTVTPEDAGVPRASLDGIKGGSAEQNAQAMRSVLEGKASEPLTDFVALNAAAALVVGNKARDLKEGMVLARKAIATGAALHKLDALVKLSNQLS